MGTPVSRTTERCTCSDQIRATSPSGTFRVFDRADDELGQSRTQHTRRRTFLRTRPALFGGSVHPLLVFPSVRLAPFPFHSTLPFAPNCVHRPLARHARSPPYLGLEPTGHGACVHRRVRLRSHEAKRWSGDALQALSWWVEGRGRLKRRKTKVE